MTNRAPDFLRGSITGQLVVIGSLGDLKAFREGLTHSDPDLSGSLGQRALKGDYDQRYEPVWLTTEPQSAPKPAEPLLKGAVVSSRTGGLFVRRRTDHPGQAVYNSCAWRTVVTGDLRQWNEIIDPEIVFPGIETDE